ncbi:MAG TPA: penicillin-binding protein 1C [Caulobacteraceae bacterium]|nr:penicillin-binding protein 1C [Caulobacteraceae bacterium]
MRARPTWPNLRHDLAHAFSRRTHDRVVPRLTLSLIAILALQLVVIGLDAAFPPDLSKAYRSSPVALDRRGAWLRALPVEHGRWRIRGDVERTDPSFVARLVALEDGRFWLHPGVDPVSAIRAAASAALHGRITSGASTLTMQDARLLEPRRRTWGAKLYQMARALQLQARLSKREQLALYLTLAPYGGNLEGVRAASLAYFGHGPETLTPAEQAMLIALPQSPEARRPDRRPAAARAARARVLDRMVRAGLLDAPVAEEAAADPLPGRQGFPGLAWHAAGELARAAPATQATVVTTLDADLQRRLEPLAAATAKGQGADAEVAILVVEAKSRAVRAAVGSAGLSAAGGWMDLTQALRSPGSALKPFIYGLAMDDGVVAADTVLDDTPRRFAEYQPENFDRVFHGNVTMREALIHSLNVPAVETLDRLGPQAFEARLTGAGARLVRPNAGDRDPGLALALGGEGISLRDLAMLYAALADDGLAKPLAWTEADARARLADPGHRLMRQASARAILDILREGPPPKGRAPGALTRIAPMAFKTGTSYGFRDAVAVGVVGGYVIAVWTGRADGGARPDMTGRDAALPLLFDVADQVGIAARAPPPIKPRGAPAALQTLDRPGAGPRLIFPPDGSTVVADGFGSGSRGFVLAASGQGIAWYVDGAPVPADPVSGKPIWRPPGPGFYRISVVDAAGRAVVARVRVAGG